MTPKVSVIVPIYHVEAYLQECLDSLVNQTLRDIEVIMVNDGSPDSSGDIMERYAAAHENFKAYHKENGGLGNARNFGLTRATGDYIAFLDSDDVVTEQAYEILFETAMETGSDIVTGNVVRFNSRKTYGSGLHKRAFHETKLNTHITKKPELIYDTTSINKIYKKSFWDRHQLRFPEGIYYEDILVTVASHYLAASVDVLEEPIYYWRSRDGGGPSITQQRDRLENFTDRLKAIQMLDDFFTEHRIEGPLKEEKEHRALTLDLRLYLNQLDRVDAHYLDVFIKEVSKHLEGIPSKVFYRLDAIDRLKYRLVQQGEKEKLLDVLRFQKEKMKRTKVIKKGRNYYGDYPYKEEFSAEFLQLNDELPVKRKIEKVKWHGSRLYIKGYNYIEKVNMKHRRHVMLAAYVKNPLTQKSVGIPVRLMKRSDVTHKRGIKADSKLPLKRLYRYDWSGYESVIDFDKEEISQLGDGRLELWFQLRAGGLTREFRAGGPVSGRKPRPPCYIDDEYKVFPRYNQAQDLILEKSPLVASVDEIKVNDQVMAIKGWSRVPLKQTSLELKNASGGAVRYFSLRSGKMVADGHTFDVHVDLGRLDDSGNATWEGSLLNDGKRLSLIVRPHVAWVNRTLQSREVRIRANNAGQFMIQYEPLAASLESMAWMGQRLNMNVNIHENIFEYVNRVESVRLSLQHVESGNILTVPCREGSSANPSFRCFTGHIKITDEDGRGLLDIGKWELYFEVHGKTEERTQVKKTPVRARHTNFMSNVVAGLKLTPYRSAREYMNLRVEPHWNRVERGPRRREVTEKVLYPLFRLLPLRKRTIVFESFWGKSYSCSPRAIHEYMERNNMGYRYVWALNNENTPVNGRAKPVRKHSWRYFYYLATAKYFVNNANFPDFYKKRKGAVEVHTLHGTPLKTMGLDTPEMAGSEAKRNQFLQRCRRWDYLLSPSRYVTDLAKQCFDYKKEVLEVGFPRNDLLKSHNEEGVMLEIKKRLGLPLQKKVMLYAPTWRVKQSFQLRLDIDKMQRELGDDWIILLRLHYFTARSIELAPYRGFAYNLSAHDDIQELFLIADVLITDYSSVMFDYANLHRPMIFFTYDLAFYRDQLRGLYIDFEKEAPGPLVKTTDELIRAIKDVDKYDHLYGNKLKAFRDKYCEFDEGDACRKVVEKVFT